MKKHGLGCGDKKKIIKSSNKFAEQEKITTFAIRFRQNKCRPTFGNGKILERWQSGRMRRS
ncbi:MAG: hypothetical protein K2G18_05955 [Bacteroidales bacterium]|nr:hypothetical protein [Bacteroidales bacterium]